MAAVAPSVAVPRLGASRPARATSLRPVLRAPSSARPNPRCRAASNETASTSSAAETATSSSTSATTETAVFALG